jgi:hypothetical protein
MVAKWIRSRSGKVLYGIILGVVLTFMLGAFPSNVSAACTGTGCIGKDPSAQGCGADAVTKKWIYTPGNIYPGLGQAQLRYSPTCLAMWARTLNTSAFWYYTAATIWWSNMVQYSYSGGTYPNQTVYTNMLSHTYSGQACGKISSSAISVPITVNNSNYCTAWW